jgi:hypothetical protein
MSPQDEEAILSNDATIKDMEVCTSSQAISFMNTGIHQKNGPVLVVAEIFSNNT